MKHNNGFTLIEVMATVAILSLGTLLIQEGLLHLANILGHYNNYLAAQESISEKTWDIKESLFFSEEPSTGGNSGIFTESGRDFNWSINASPISGMDNLYSIQWSVGWMEGNKPANLSAAVYATTTKPPKV